MNKIFVFGLIALIISVIILYFYLNKTDVIKSEPEPESKEEIFEIKKQNVIATTSNILESTPQPETIINNSIPAPESGIASVNATESNVPVDEAAVPRTIINNENINITQPVIAPSVVSQPTVAPPVVAPSVVSQPVVSQPVVAPSTVASPAVAPPTVAPPTVAPPTVSKPSYIPNVVNVHSVIPESELLNLKVNAIKIYKKKEDGNGIIFGGLSIDGNTLAQKFTDRENTSIYLNSGELGYMWNKNMANLKNKSSSWSSRVEEPLNSNSSPLYNLVYDTSFMRDYHAVEIYGLKDLEISNVNRILIINNHYDELDKGEDASGIILEFSFKTMNGQDYPEKYLIEVGDWENNEGLIADNTVLYKSKTFEVHNFTQDPELIKLNGKSFEVKLDAVSAGIPITNGKIRLRNVPGTDDGVQVHGLELRDSSGNKIDNWWATETLNINGLDVPNVPKIRLTRGGDKSRNILTNNKPGSSYEGWTSFMSESVRHSQYIPYEDFDLSENYLDIYLKEGITLDLKTVRVLIPHSDNLRVELHNIIPGDQNPYVIDTESAYWPGYDFDVSSYPAKKSVIDSATLENFTNISMKSRDSTLLSNEFLHLKLR